MMLVQTYLPLLAIATTVQCHVEHTGILPAGKLTCKQHKKEQVKNKNKNKKEIRHLFMVSQYHVQFFQLG